MTAIKRKKILFVSARLPYPTIEGHQIRTFGLLSELSKYYDIHLLSILRKGEYIDKVRLLTVYQFHPVFLNTCWLQQVLLSEDCL